MISCACRLFNKLYFPVFIVGLSAHLCHISHDTGNDRGGIASSHKKAHCFSFGAQPIGGEFRFVLFERQIEGDPVFRLFVDLLQSLGNMLGLKPSMLQLLPNPSASFFLRANALHRQLLCKHSVVDVLFASQTVDRQRNQLRIVSFLLQPQFQLVFRAQTRRQEPDCVQICLLLLLGQQYVSEVVNADDGAFGEPVFDQCIFVNGKRELFVDKQIVPVFKSFLPLYFGDRSVMYDLRIVFVQSMFTPL